MEYVEIKLKDVEGNPYRNADVYKLEKKRISALKDSIRQTGFWSNIVGRMTEDGGFQIAYGHHRLQAAIEELGPNHVQSFPIAEIPDYQMLQMMGLENSEDWGNTTAHNNLTVETARDLIEEYLDEYPTWEEGLKGDLHGIAKRQLKEWFDDSKGRAVNSYTRAVNDGVGVNILTAFLGWNKNKVSYAIAEIGVSDRQHEKDKAKLVEMKDKAKLDEAKFKAKVKEQEKRVKASKKLADKEAQKAFEAHVQKEMDKADQDIADMEAEMAEQGIYDPKAGEVFDKPIHAKAFREMVTDDDFQAFLPMNAQKAFAKSVKHAVLMKGEVSARGIEREGLRKLQAAQGEQAKSDDPFKRHGTTIHYVMQKAQGTANGVSDLINIMKEEKIVGLHGEKAKNLDKQLRKTFGTIARFYAQFGVEAPKLSRAERNGVVTSYNTDGANERPLYLGDFPEDWQAEIIELFNLENAA